MVQNFINKYQVNLLCSIRLMKKTPVLEGFALLGKKDFVINQWILRAGRRLRPRKLKLPGVGLLGAYKIIYKSGSSMKCCSFIIQLNIGYILFTNSQFDLLSP